VWEALIQRLSMEKERHTGRQGALQHLASIHVVCSEQRKKDGRCGVKERRRGGRGRRKKKGKRAVEKKRIESLLVAVRMTEKRR
jgi:hypothetical protein